MSSASDAGSVVADDGGSESGGGKAANAKKRNDCYDSDEDEDGPMPIGWHPFEEPFAGEGELFAHKPHNEVYFYCGVSRGSVKCLMRTMERMRIAEGCAAVREAREARPITLRISSEGGSLHDGLAAHDYLRARFPDLITVADGLCASAGTFLLLAGEDRRVQPNAFVLVHQLREEIGGLMTNTDLQDLAAVNSSITKAMRRLYRSRTNIPKELLDTLFSREMYLTAEECIEHGIVHCVDRGWPGQNESPVAPRRRRAAALPRSVFAETDEEEEEGEEEEEEAEGESEEAEEAEEEGEEAEEEG